jgi:hypothetical protein
MIERSQASHSLVEVQLHRCPKESRILNAFATTQDYSLRKNATEILSVQITVVVLDAKVRLELRSLSCFPRVVALSMPRYVWGPPPFSRLPMLRSMA